jgi:hypothetical protein
MDGKPPVNTEPEERGPTHDILPVISSEWIFQRSYAIYA